MDTTEIILRENGIVTERVIRERNLEAGPALEALTEAVTRSVRHVLFLPPGLAAHANVGHSDTLWSIGLRQIELNTRFRLVDGVMVPVFDSGTDLEMRLVWQAPPEVRLVLAVRVETVEDDAVIGGNWLFACDAANRAYRLPLPNLHDECQICTGSFGPKHPTAAQCLAASLDQFRNSHWNADLMRAIESSQKFFRFRPTDTDFQSLPVAATDWTTLCDKVSTSISDRLIL